MTTLTLKLGGALLDDPATLQGTADQLARLQAEGVRPVVVHGGGAQIGQALAAAGIPEQRHRGLRITPPEAASTVQREMDALGLELTAALVRAGCRAFHAPSAAGRLTATPKLAGDGVDLGRVGTPVGFDALGLPGPVGGAVPVVTPVGMDAQGPLNVNADEGAAAIAAALASDLLVLATDVPHVRDGTGAPVGRLDAKGVQALIAEGTAQGGMIPKLEASLTALRAGVGRVVITDLAPGRLTALVGRGPPAGTVLGAPEVPA